MFRIARRIGAGPAAWWLLLLPMFASAMSRGWWAPDEPRYAEVAREAFASGHLLVMHLSGGVYPDKPPLLFWIAGAIGSLTGWNVAAMRLVSIAATFVTALGIGVLARRWWGEREAAWAPGIFLGMALVTEIGGRLQIDPLLACLTTIALALLDSSRRSSASVRCAWLLVGLGVLAKGPVALLIVALVLVAWRLAPGARRDPEPSHARAPILDWTSTVLLIAPVMGWAGAAILLEPELARALLFDQHAGRVASGSAAPHARPWHYYAAALPALTLPWTLPLAAGLAAAAGAARRAGRDVGLLRSALWFCVLLAFFSAIPPKRHLYLLPSFPAAALLTARAWVDLEQRARTRWIAVARASVPSVQIALGAVLLLAAIAVVAGIGPLDGLREKADEIPGLDLLTSAAGLIPGAAILLLGGLATWRALSDQAADRARRYLFASWGIGAAAILFPAFTALDPVKSSERLAWRIAPLVEQLEIGAVPFFAIRPEGPRFYAQFDAVYSDALPTADPDDPSALLAAWRRKAEQAQQGRLAVVERRTWDRIADQERALWPVLFEDRLGSKELIVVGTSAKAP